jgi:hypothetical protein
MSKATVWGRPIRFENFGCNRCSVLAQDYGILRRSSGGCAESVITAA